MGQNGGLRKSILGVLLIAGITFGAAAYYQVSFRGLDVAETQVDAGGSIDLQTNVVNLKKSPYTDLSVAASLVRRSDGSRVVEQELVSDLDLAAREIRNIDATVPVPADAVSGDHVLRIAATTPAGTPMAVISEDITVDNTRDQPSLVFDERGVYIQSEKVVVGENTVMRFELPSFGTEGENVLPDRTFDVRMALTNPGSEPVSADATISITPTYSTEADSVESFTRDLGTIEPGATEEYSFSTQVTQPGTYVVRASVTGDEGQDLADGEVRLVIAGGGGSIVDLDNAQDTYTAGETASLTASVVGPADGSTEIRDAFLRLEVTKDGSVVERRETTIDRLPFTPEDHKFSFTPDNDLEQYTVRLTLGKGDTVYDTYTASYEPLHAERMLSEDGQVRTAGQCYDDGTCTAAEYDAGGCYDCIGVEERPGGDTEQTGTEPGTGLSGLTRTVMIAAIGAVIVLAAVVRLRGG